jgi:hypothetical protein
VTDYKKRTYEELEHMLSTVLERNRQHGVYIPEFAKEWMRWRMLKARCDAEMEAEQVECAHCETPHCPEAMVRCRHCEKGFCDGCANAELEVCLSCTVHIAWDTGKPDPAELLDELRRKVEALTKDLSLQECPGCRAFTTKVSALTCEHCEKQTCYDCYSNECPDHKTAQKP